MIKIGDKVIVLPYEGSHLCPVIDAAIKSKTVFEAKEFHGEDSKYCNESAVLLRIGKYDRVFDVTEVKRINKD